MGLGVVYIGDRATGKTALATELINPDLKKWVHISGQSYDNLKRILCDDLGNFKGTDIDRVNVSSTRRFEVQVKLPSGPQIIPVDWVDTPGEVWRRYWPKENPQQWQKILANLSKSEGIMLILPPYRDLPDLKTEVAMQFPTQEQWCYRFQRWVSFFRSNCHEARHILICLNKADLFCDLNTEVNLLEYNPEGSMLNWFRRNSYIKQKYFYPIEQQIMTINEHYKTEIVKCFITSIKNRSLLELPWIYLAGHLR